MSTALVPAADVSSPIADLAHVRPRADFLAQLIATAAQAPQTRLRRRAEPAEAVALYGTTEQRAAARNPVMLGSL